MPGFLPRSTATTFSGGTNTTLYFLDPATTNARLSSFPDFKNALEEVASGNPGSKLIL